MKSAAGGLEGARLLLDIIILVGRNRVVVLRQHRNSTHLLVFKLLLSGSSNKSRSRSSSPRRNAAAAAAAAVKEWRISSVSLVFRGERLTLFFSAKASCQVEAFPDNEERKRQIRVLTKRHERHAQKDRYKSESVNLFYLRCL